MPLTLETVSGILQLGGTILRTSRTNPRKMEGGIDKCLATIKANHLDALITIGGDDTQGCGQCFGAGRHQDRGACLRPSITTSAERMRVSVSTPPSPSPPKQWTACIPPPRPITRVIVCEVMGRDAGWIAITSGIAGGADVIFVPEKPIDIEGAVKILKDRHGRGKLFSIVVVAEGAKACRQSGDPRRQVGRFWSRSPQRHRASGRRTDRGKKPATKLAL